MLSFFVRQALHARPIAAARAGHPQVTPHIAVSLSIARDITLMLADCAALDHEAA
jgi:hypothetical protein